MTGDDPLAAVEGALGYRFRDRELLQRALRHGSAGGEDYQRLEFLGDAVLGHAVAELLYERRPELDEGGLTRLKALLVRAETLAGLGRKLGLGEAAEVGRSEELAGGRARRALLEDLLEAVVGAVAVDGGWEAARALVDRLLGDVVATASLDDVAAADPKSALQEAAQARGLPLPEYREVRSWGPDHLRRFAFEVVWDGEVVARGEGRSKKEAQREAARRALVRLGLAPRGS